MYKMGDEVKDHTSELLESTVRAAGKYYHDAFEHVLKHGKSIYGVARQRAANNSKIVDRSIHEHIYQTIAIGIRIGVIFGYVLSRPRD